MYGQLCCGDAEFTRTVFAQMEKLALLLKSLPGCGAIKAPDVVGRKSDYRIKNTTVGRLVERVGEATRFTGKADEDGKALKHVPETLPGDTCQKLFTAPGRA
jgi:hypothetical protein